MLHWFAKRLKEAKEKEEGFTLIELLVTMGIMVIALLALHSVFNTSMRVLSFSNDKVESTENARVALERMEREIRAAYPYNQTAATPDMRVLDVSSGGVSGNRITFFNDLNGNSRICRGATPPAPPPPTSTCTAAPEDTGETISFYTSGGNLIRSQSSATGVTAETLTALGSGGSLEFEYFNRTTPDVAITNPSANEANIDRVRIKLEVVEEGPWVDTNQELITNADLRNRGD